MLNDSTLATPHTRKQNLPLDYRQLIGHQEQKAGDCRIQTEEAAKKI
jgi:hypothetical protein